MVVGHHPKLAVKATTRGRFGAARRGKRRKKGRVSSASDVSVSARGAESVAATDPLVGPRNGADLVEIMEMNFYDALNVQPGATNAEIRRAFKAVA